MFESPGEDKGFYFTTLQEHTVPFVQCTKYVI